MIYIKNRIVICAFNNEGTTKPVEYTGKLPENLESADIRWTSLHDDYYVYIAHSFYSEDGIFVINSWKRYHIPSFFEFVNFTWDISQMGFTLVNEIPTENTTGFSEFRIEHDDLLEIEGDGIDVELTADGRRKKLKLSAEGGGGGGSFDITDGTETVSIDPDDQVTLVGDGVEIEVSEDNEDSTKKEIKLTVAGGGAEPPELFLDFEEEGDEFVYNVPYRMKFTSQNNESTNPVLSIPLDTVMDEFDKLTVTATAGGLVRLYGEYVE